MLLYGVTGNTHTHASHPRNLKDYISLQHVFLKGQHTPLYSSGYPEIHQISSTPPRPTTPPRVSIAPALNLSSLISLAGSTESFQGQVLCFQLPGWHSVPLIYDTSLCIWHYGRCQLTGKSPWSLPGIWVNISLNRAAEFFNFLM